MARRGRPHTPEVDRLLRDFESDLAPGISLTCGEVCDALITLASRAHVTLRTNVEREMVRQAAVLAASELESLGVLTDARALVAPAWADVDQLVAETNA